MIWCCGMYASGSTWTYNAARAAGLAAGARIEARYAENFRQLGGMSRPDATYVVKTHDVDERATRVLQRRAMAIFLTIRDPRDAVLSVTRHMGMDFSAALAMVARSALYCGRIAAAPRATLLRYESGFIDDPATFDTLAAAFGRALTPDQRDHLFAQTRREVIEARIAGLAALSSTIAIAETGDVVDLDTQWHAHHANRTGEVGRWRTHLNANQVWEVERTLSGWMEAFGYAF